MFGTTCKDVLNRLVRMLVFSGAVSREDINELIGANVDLLLHVKRFSDGKLRVKCISEVEIANAEVNARRLFYFRQSETEPTSSTGDFVKMD